MDKLGFSRTSAVIILLGLIWCTLLLTHSKLALISSFVLYTCFRTFFFTFLFAYLADTLGFQYFGVLSGVMFIFGGLVGVFQYFLTLYASGKCYMVMSENTTNIETLCTSGKWFEVNCVMTVCILCCLVFSYCDYLRREKQKTLNNNDNDMSVEITNT